MRQSVKSSSGLKIRTIFGKDSKFRGRLKFSDSLQIDGLFEGSIESDGLLVIGDSAEIRANLDVASIIVSGFIQGDVIAGNRLEILPGACIVGDVRCTNLLVSEGAKIRGLCEMLRKPESHDIFSLPLDRFRKNLDYVL